MAGESKAELEETVWAIEPHTTLKHLAYRKYVECWMAKILTKFPTAYIVDAFAGPGVYKLGQPGSPILAAKSYIQHARRPKFGRLDILCSEQRHDRVERLHVEIDKLYPPTTLRIDVLPSGRFEDRLSDLLHRTSEPRQPPVLWIIDPFNIAAVGMENLKRCLAGPRNEVILTFFVDEMYRLAGKNPNMAPALDRQFGNASWRGALDVIGEGAKKESFTSSFCESLADACGVKTASFGIRMKNASSRYELIFGTRADAGLECWAGMTWAIDRIAGRRTSMSDAGQDDLFSSVDTSRLQAALVEFAGREMSWADLVAISARNQFKETHLRSALDELNALGLALRTSPIEAKTDWPTGCAVQLHSPMELENE